MKLSFVLLLLFGGIYGLIIRDLNENEFVSRDSTNLDNSDGTKNAAMSDLLAKLNKLEEKITQMAKENELLNRRLNQSENEQHQLKQAISLQNMSISLLKPIFDFFSHSGFSLNIVGDEMNHHLQEIRLKIGQLEQHPSTAGYNSTQKHPNLPKNRWILNTDFFILKPNYLKAVYRAKTNAHRYLYAKFVLFPHLSLAYYETKIIRKHNRNITTISIGIWTKSDDTFYKYSDNGFIFGHNANGFGGYPSFDEGDTIGCGANLTSMEIIYTKNGEQLDTSN
ncbi:hypothetical protein niasHS_009388 [Heterodera schachtii]|uniref:SPRY domain-containing protein n=1 Tax=Heterodera schachtii TaxID=97005 RepID=A0ABD2JC49_HETSC